MTHISKRPWLAYALVTTLFWGVWGAFIEIPEKAGFPATLGYVVWAIMMVPCALFALQKINWKLSTQPKNIGYGLLVGLTGAGGQLLLFQALREGPAYLVFPLISLFPVVTIFLSLLFLKERAAGKAKMGIILALVAIALLSYQPPSQNGFQSYWWLLLAALVFFMWGIQAFVMKLGNATMEAESMFFYMTVAGLLLIPIAIYMTDFSQPVNWGWKGPWLAASIHMLNAIGALTLVYALRFGKAIIVVPLTGLSPVITILISLLIYSVVPNPVTLLGLVIAVLAIYLITE